MGIEAEITNSLSKQRKSAIASARKGRKKLASRNSQKDKGGRSSHNSKAQMQMSSWWDYMGRQNQCDWLLENTECIGSTVCHLLELNYLFNVQTYV